MPDVVNKNKGLKSAGLASRARDRPSYTNSHLPSMEILTKMKELVKHHVESYNEFITEGLNEAVADLPDIETKLVSNLDSEKDGESPFIRIWIEAVALGYPMRSKDESALGKLTPRECRERGLTYGAPISASFAWQINDGDTMRVQRNLGEIPVMVCSSRCHLTSLTPEQLVSYREEDIELGGYFIVNGLERIIRCIQVPRRDYPMAINRDSFKKKGNTFTEKAITIRCGRRDNTTKTVVLHYLTTGSALLKWTINKSEIFIPVVILIKALRDITDRELYDRVVAGEVGNTSLSARVEVLLLDTARMDLHTREQCLNYLGSRFRFYSQRTDIHSDMAVGLEMINRYILVHLTRHEDKQELLIFMLRKLYTFAQGGCSPDNPDSLNNHELLLPGHLMTIYLKERMEWILLQTRSAIRKDAAINIKKARVDIHNPKYISKVIDRTGKTLGKSIQSFISTGNAITYSGLDLMQESGFTVVAERINMLRYLSHFRSVHRGSFFMTLRTTSVRKLLPESWGFLCPVHTPDGSPCGLLNHMTLECTVVSSRPALIKSDLGTLEQILVSLGVTPSGIGAGDGSVYLPYFFLPVVLDGRVLGGATYELLQDVEKALRRLKATNPPKVEPTLELALFPPMVNGSGPFPGLFLFTAAGRMIRPVLNLDTCQKEWIGPLEQPFLEVACLASEARASNATHCEIDPNNMLSLIASLTPFSDYNQSPRNMYQCQMGKQTMGTSAHSLSPHKTDNKMYRILFPQAPIVSTRNHRKYQMDNYPQGTNAVVAVISYTGFDMEDAMILNKSSYERGFGHASVMKTTKYNLLDMMSSTRERKTVSKLSFSNSKPDGSVEKHNENLDNDGFAPIGSWVEEGDPIYCIYDSLEDAFKVGVHKESEKACIENVRALGGTTLREPMMKVSVTLRFPRNPQIGDKFSSRHGQKGVMSILWPQADMPFSESGMSPDIIINPHAFPSRMTIGMLIESMAGKAGALHGYFQDATPFTFHEKDRAIDYFGDQLRSAGYAYYGSEPLYSGISGTVMHADIFIGLVYYQRLRHMVSDKSQVRATGLVNPLTRQPIKGRKNKGGIRFGEMERDSLLSHGAAFLMQDRLMNCSDRHIGYACSKCGSLLTPCHHMAGVSSASREVSDIPSVNRMELGCLICGSEGRIESLSMPYVFRYLVNELAGMGIKLTMDIA